MVINGESGYAATQPNEVKLEKKNIFFIKASGGEGGIGAHDGGA